jgi:hypothetical protein
MDNSRAESLWQVESCVCHDVLPDQRGHEVCVLTSFVAYYNALSGTAFALERILDDAGSSAQPEALYVDARTCEKLVIEHKTFVWPPEHFKLHCSGHEVAALIKQTIQALLSPDKPYVLELRDDMRGSRTELRAFGENVGAIIRAGIDAVHGGEMLSGRAPNRRWVFRVEEAFEREYYQPSTGLVVSFEGAWSTLPTPDMTAQLSGAFNVMLARVAPKFEGHADARRLLVLDPHGDVRFTPDEEWAKLLSMADVPANVQEIWLSFHDFITDTLCGWTHQRI